MHVYAVVACTKKARFRHFRNAVKYARAEFSRVGLRKIDPVKSIGRVKAK
jgi:hypothetical protein